jgi:hypothetical protein
MTTLFQRNHKIVTNRLPIGLLIREELKEPTRVDVSHFVEN